MIENVPGRAHAQVPNKNQVIGKNKKWAGAAALVGAVALSPAFGAGIASAAPVKVSYQVAGSGQALAITYWDENGTKQVQNNVALPWNKSVTIGRNIHIRLNAQVMDGEVDCKIILDGKNTSEVKARFSANCEADVRGDY